MSAKNKVKLFDDIYLLVYEKSVRVTNCAESLYLKQNIDNDIIQSLKSLLTKVYELGKEAKAKEISKKYQELQNLLKEV